MKLKYWLIKENITNNLFAKKLGVSGQAVSAWLKGQKNIKPELIWKIYWETNCEVKPHDLQPELYPLKEMKQIYGCSRCKSQPIAEDYEAFFKDLIEKTPRRFNRNRRKAIVIRKKTSTGK